MFVNYLDVVGYNAEPVLLSHPAHDELDINLLRIMQERPEYEFTTTDKIKHEVWVVKGKDIILIQKFFQEMDALYIADSDTKFPIRRIQYYTTGKKPLDHQRATEAWERMLMDPNPKIQELAHDLVKYTFFANGYGFGPFSFANIVPVKFWTDDYQRQNNITDIQGRTFNEFLESALQSDYLAKDAVVEARFKKQFMQNYADREGFVKSVTPDLVMPKTDITDPEKLNYEVTIKARDSRQGVIISPKGYLVINKKKNPQLKPFGDQSKPIEFVKVYLINSQGQFTGKYTLYQHSSSEYDAKNREMFEGKTNIDTFTYKPIAVLGHNQFALEFDFDNDITESNVKRNLKVKPVTTISNMEAYESQMQDEAMNNIIKSEERGFNPEGDVEQSLGGLTAQAATQPTTSAPSNSLSFLKANADETINNRTALTPFTEYKNVGGTLSEEEFLSLSPNEQKSAIESALNC
jgi:hypothetical protein